MKVAMIAPPWYRVPPRGYGGIESLVAGLVDGLVGMHHEVMLVCAGPSGTRAQVVRQTLPEAPSDMLADEAVSLLHAQLAEEAIRDFAPDLVHDHTLPGLVASATRPYPTVVTAHGPVTGCYGGLLTRNSRAHVVAISRSQMRSSTAVAWHGVVHNGVPVDAFPFRCQKEDFLLFLGRMDPDKGVVEAIEVAERSGATLVIAARLHGHAEETFFRTQVRPRLGGRIEYVGEVNQGDKLDLLGRASALLFPLQWEEPYGLVVAEAQACGTPVLSLRRGAIPEIVDDGTTGFLADHHLELVDKVERVRTLSPLACRRFAQEHLDVARCVRGYDAVYQSVLAAHRVGEPLRPSSSLLPQKVIDLRRVDPVDFANPDPSTVTTTPRRTS